VKAAARVLREDDAGESASTGLEKASRGGPAETQDDVRTSFSGRRIAERRWFKAVAGPGL
jgi:hypothetical protein